MADILDRMHQASRMPTPPALWCAEAADEIANLRNEVARLKAKEEYWKGIGKVIEESGEVLQLLGKAIPFPVGDHPDGKGPIRDRLPDELSDLKAAVVYFEQTNGLKSDAPRQHSKLAKFRKWGLTGVVDLGAKSYRDEKPKETDHGTQ